MYDEERWGIASWIVHAAVISLILKIKGKKKKGEKKANQPIHWPYTLSAERLLSYFSAKHKFLLLLNLVRC